MKRNGFTIAEALITMAIVGVVAALTIPTFISDYRKQVYAKSLAVAVSNFETAMGAMMMKEGVSDLRETKAWIDMHDSGIKKGSDESNVKKFVTQIGKHLIINNTILDSNEYYSPKGVYSIDNTFYHKGPNAIGLLSKNNQVYWVLANKNSTYERKESEILALGGNMTAAVAAVVIDINGKSKPNVYGRDIFFFELGCEGRLYPAGGIDSSVYNNLITTDVWSNPSSIFRCLDGNTYRPSYGCTARLIENGYKMDY